jgi:RNA polymerase sigma-70 factor, ECF subfamily
LLETRNSASGTGLRLRLSGSGAGQANTRLVSLAITRAKEGDQEALGFLYARYAENVCAYVCSIVHDQYQAEDITQHVFTKLVKAVRRYEEREVPFLAWILRVARNAAIDQMRSERLVPVEEVRSVQDTGPHRTSSTSTQDLREALETLPVAQREVVFLRHVAGLSPTEIASLTGKSKGSIHGLHHRGRKALASELTSRGLAPSTMGSSRRRVEFQELKSVARERDYGMPRAMRPLSQSAR